MHRHQMGTKEQTVLLGHTHYPAEKLRNARLQKFLGQNSPEPTNRVKAKRKGRE